MCPPGPPDSRVRTQMQPQFVADAPAGRVSRDRRVEGGKVQFVLTGFTQDMGFRVFSFDCVGDDRVRTRCTVRADLALIRRYGIQIQELPLLCRTLLDRSGKAGESVTFTEEEMRVCANDRAVARGLAASRSKARA